LPSTDLDDAIEVPADLNETTVGEKIRSDLDDKASAWKKASSLNLTLSPFVVAFRTCTEGANCTCLAQLTDAGRCDTFLPGFLEPYVAIAWWRAAERPLLRVPLR
jgi:hypothetical protein